MTYEPAIFVASVSGSGKSTIGRLLADRLGVEFTEGDGFHSSANIAKMRNGIPLEDEDRTPWLDAITSWMLSRHEGCVVSCSALKS